MYFLATNSKSSEMPIHTEFNCQQYDFLNHTRNKSLTRTSVTLVTLTKYIYDKLRDMPK